MIYADSSFTFSLYALDDNTARAAEIYKEDRRRPLCLTVWQELELANTFRLGIQRSKRRKLPIRYQPANCLKRVQEDLRDGILKRVELDWATCVRRASQLSQAHTETLGIVMLDIWHVASALESGADTFWTFDEDQRKLATATRHFKTVIGLKP